MWKTLFFQSGNSYQKIIIVLQRIVDLHSCKNRLSWLRVYLSLARGNEKQFVGKLNRSLRPCKQQSGRCYHTIHVRNWLAQSC